jgi:hypothetical protein
VSVGATPELPTRDQIQFKLLRDQVVVPVAVDPVPVEKFSLIKVIIVAAFELKEKRQITAKRIQMREITTKILLALS